MNLNKTKPSKFIFCISFCLIFIGSISIGYSYGMYPSLVPRYGGGEGFLLENYNNYTEIFPFSAKTNLFITMNANDTVQISINDENVYNGTYYQVEIEPTTEVLITLKSISPVNGRLTLRQEIPLYLEIFSVGVFLIGIISLVLNWVIFKKKSINRNYN